MLNDVDTVGSPAWWLKRLGTRQAARHERLDRLQRWMSGDPPLPVGAPQWQAAYQAWHRNTRTNLAELIVESVRERLTPIGFRTGAENDDNGDTVAARVWAVNEMPVEQVDLLTWMLGLSVGYTMIAPAPAGTDVPLITAEDPRQVITAHDPARRSLVRAGLKTYHDPDEGIEVCWVYLPGVPGQSNGRAQAYRGTRPVSSIPMFGLGFDFYDGRKWVWDDPISLPTTRVPIVQYANRGGVAEFETHIDLLSRINRTTLQRMLIAELQAFRQRAIKSLPEVYPVGHPLAGQRIDYDGVFTPGPGSLWQVPEGVDFWESTPIDLNPILNAERADIRTLAALTRIPISYFNPDDANGSAEGASLQREGLVYRAEDRQTLAGAGFAQTMSLAFEMMGDTARADVSQIQTLWAPVERLSLTERYNAAVQAKGAGLANDTIRREVLGFTPDQMTRADADDARDMVLGVKNTSIGAGVSNQGRQASS